MKQSYSEYNNHKINLEDRKREFFILPRVLEYGYITGCIGLPIADRICFQNKLEFCIRISGSSDRIVHFINDTKYVNTCPHILVKPPLGQYHIKDIPMRDVFYILYAPEQMDFFKESGFIGKTLSWDIELTPEISNLINSLKEMMENSMSFGFADQVDLKCMQLIQELALLRKKLGNPSFSNQMNVNRIVSYFSLHYCDNFSLDELLELNGFSRSTFFRHWAKYFQISPARYMMNLRIEEARKILLETNSTVEDIARVLKFSSATYFCSVFRNICGCTPLQYRRRNRKEKSNETKST